jgi:nicotinamide mononucleotide transporter PnuC
VYYLIISCLGWYWWAQGTGHRVQSKRNNENEGDKGRMGEGENGRMGEWEKGRRREVENITLQVTRLKLRTGLVLAIVFVVLYAIMWLVLSNFTDSPVPGWDSFITSLSIVATWMLARKIYEHWLLWIVVNSVAVILFLSRGLYPTVILYVVYGIMSFVGLTAWKKTIRTELSISEK